MLLLPRAQPLFQRSKFPLIDFLIDFLDQVVAAAARRKILLHFGVPGLFFKLLNPVCQFLALWPCELLDLGFDCFHGHIPSLAFLDLAQSFIGVFSELVLRVGEGFGPAALRRKVCE